MKTNFFETLASLKVEGNWSITIKKTDTGNLLVAVLLTSEGVKDDASKIIPPMNFKGTAKELDEGFFLQLEKPAKQTAELFSNMQQYMEQLEEAREKSKMEQNKNDGEKKEKEERKKKYETQIKKVIELEEKEKFGEAIGQMPKAGDFPEQAEEIKKKLEELRQKHGQLSLL